MNDFRPLKSIVRTLVNDSDDKLIDIYLYTSICQYCYHSGIRFSMLQGLVNISINNYITGNNPLKLQFNPDDRHYVKALNEPISEMFLEYFKETNYEILYNAMIKLAKSFAPYVNRNTIKLQTPEARTSRRLLNYQDAVSKFILRDADEFYGIIQAEWDWNSRYWEQRALGMVYSDLKIALGYAKHAISIEKHPFTLNTYATVLHEYMKQDKENISLYYEEIVLNLIEAIDKEKYYNRITVYPLTTLLSSTLTYLNQYNKINDDMKHEINKMIDIVINNIPQKNRFDEMINDIKRRW
jgi:hypothetical protein